MSESLVSVCVCVLEKGVVGILLTLANSRLWLVLVRDRSCDCSHGG